MPAFFTRFLDLFDVCIQLRMFRNSLSDFVVRKSLLLLIETTCNLHKKFQIIFGKTVSPPVNVW